jgi:hypothetical protein
MNLISIINRLFHFFLFNEPVTSLSRREISIPRNKILLVLIPRTSFPICGRLGFLPRTR